MNITFKATARCPRLPAHLTSKEARKPCPQLSDDDVDTCLQFMIDHGAGDMLLPATQYGRRCAVEAHLRYEAIVPVFVHQEPWAPKNPTQPR